MVRDNPLAIKTTKSISNGGNDRPIVRADGNCPKRMQPQGNLYGSLQCPVSIRMKQIVLQLWITGRTELFPTTAQRGCIRRDDPRPVRLDPGRRPVEQVQQARIGSPSNPTFRQKRAAQAGFTILPSVAH